MRGLLTKLRRKRDTASLFASDRVEDRAIMSEVRVVGGALVSVLIISLVLTEVYNAVDFETDADGDYTGPFGDIVAQAETTGVAAITLLIVGLIVLAASVIMRFMGGGFGR